jgi:hypothetical protein
LEELTPEDQQKVGMLFTQLDSQIPAESRAQMYPMVLMQMKGSRGQVPPKDMKVFLYVTQEMARRIEALPAPEAVDPAKDPIEAPAGG